MGSYIPATGEERQAMLQAIGLTSVEELFDVVPDYFFLQFAFFLLITYNKI